MVRAPLNEVERKEIEAWKAERRKHWPTEANVSKKQKDLERGVGTDDARQITLGDVLDTQQRLGLLRKAGTEDLVKQLQKKHGDRNRGERGEHGGTRVGKEAVKKPRGVSGRGFDRQPQKKERKLTLLERLLEKDIKSYESKVVQLFHFIHMNDFFRETGKELVFIPATRPNSGQQVASVLRGDVDVDVDITAGEEDEDEAAGVAVGAELGAGVDKNEINAEDMKDERVSDDKEDDGNEDDDEDLGEGSQDEDKREDHTI